MFVLTPVHRFLLAFSEKNIWECSSEWNDDYQTIAEHAFVRLNHIIQEADQPGVVFFAWIMFPDNAMILNYVKSVVVRELQHLVEVQSSRQRRQGFQCDPKIEADGQDLVLFSSFTLSVMRGYTGGPNDF